MGIVKCKCGRNTTFGLTCVFCQDLLVDMDFEKKEPESEELGLKEIDLERFEEILEEEVE